MSITGGRQLSRFVHDTLVFETLSSDGPLSRAELAQRLDITKITVLDTTERLTEIGLIEEVGRSQHKTRGPKAVLYGVPSKLAFGLTVEIHRHAVSLEVVDIAGSPLAVHTAEATDREANTEVLLEAVRTVCDAAGVDPRGAAASVIATAGGVSPETGHPISWDVPHWRRNIRTDLATVLGGEIELENEINLRGIAEHFEGTRRGVPDFVYLALGAGLGAALFADGRLLRGRNGLAGEIGYLPIDPELLRNGDSVSEQAAVRGSIRQILGSDAVNALATAHGFDGDPQAALRAAAGEDASAEALGFLEAYADRASLAVGALLAVLDTGSIVLGGDYGVAGGYALADRILERLQGMYRPLSVRPPDVLVSTVVDQPVRVGARTLLSTRLRETVLERAGYAVDVRFAQTVTSSLRPVP